MFRKRQYLILFVFMSALIFLLGRLFFIQVTEFERFSSMARSQHNRVVEVEPRRGTIFDRYMDPLAINLDVPSVYCDPRSIHEKEKTAGLLSRALDIPFEEIAAKLESDRAFVWVKRKIDRSSYERLRKDVPRGVYFVTESKRKYPNDSMASHVIGFAGIDNTGLEGLEMMYDTYLKGRPGWRHMMRDARMRTVLYDEKGSVPAQNGQNLILTIDSVVQFIAEEELSRMVGEFRAEGGTLIVMDPHTGKVLAMANYPDYDLNHFSDAPVSHRKNMAVSGVYEPGSVFKIVAAAAAIEEGSVSLEDRIYCENGKYRVRGRVLNDFRPYGELSFREVISRSSNIGIVKAAMDIGEEKLFNYIEKFGFGARTGINMPGEVTGISRHPSTWWQSDITTIPMGQGIAVTPIQLAAAISVIANGGYLIPPKIVDKITTWEGSEIKVFSPGEKRRVINTSTCDKMKDALRHAVEEGTGRPARSAVYVSAGKTGTAQIPAPEGGYYPDRYYASFIGFAPVDDPMISVVVIARDPRVSHFGGTVAGPVFRRVTERTLQYLGAERIKR